MKEYIERETVLTAFGNEPEVWCERDPVEIQERNDWHYYRDIVGAIPVADVAPVRHGRWDSNSIAIVCSECGRAFNLVEMFAHYCPWCGALMDGKEDEYENQS